MTQPGETTDFKASEHVKAILEHAVYPNIIDTVILNDSLPADISPEYKKSNSFPVVNDVDAIKKLGINVVKTRLYEENAEKYVRHSPRRLARAIYYWYKKMQKK